MRVEVAAPNSLDCLCGRKATVEEEDHTRSSGAVCKGRGGRPNSPYGLCGRKATLNLLSIQSLGAV